MARFRGNNVLFSPNITVGEPVFRYSTMPTASSGYSGKIVEYIGTTTANYTQGYFYKCVETSTDVYAWQQINVQPSSSGAVTSVNGKTGVVVLDAEDVGAVETEEGKGLSTNDFTNYYKNKIGDKYEKPSGGIPKTDLASDVQTSLEKADSALQSHQDISGKENTSNKVTSVSSASTDTQYPSAKCVYDNLVVKQDKVDHSKYLDITNGGMVYLKAEYRGAVTQAEINNGIATEQYSKSNNGLGQNGSLIQLLPKKLIIPNKINNIDVTSLAVGMFCENDWVEEITIPLSVTIIPNGFCAHTKHLQSVVNTEQIENVGEFAFATSGIYEINLPECTTYGRRCFLNATRLMKIILSNNLTSLAERMFECCNNLIYVKGGGAITTIPNSCFFATFNLKEIDFMSSVTTLGNQAFEQSKFNHNWSSITTRGTHATPLEMHASDWWSSSVITTCENPLTTTYNQMNTMWADEITSPNNVDPLNRTWDIKRSCYFNATMFAYCALHKTYRNITPFDMQDVAKSYVDQDQQHTALDYWGFNASATKTMAEKMGLTVQELTGYTTANINTLYTALSQGKYAYLETALSRNSAGARHIVLAYGANSVTREILVVSSAWKEHEIYDKEILTAKTMSMPLQNLIDSTDVGGNAREQKILIFSLS